MSSTTVAYVRSLVKRSQHLMNAGNTQQALQYLLRARSATWDLDQPTEGAYFLPRIYHRLAQAYAADGRISESLALFAKAEEAFDSTNAIGKAIALRDHGMIVWQYVNYAEGERLIRSALKTLRRSTTTNERWELEYIVTEGFLARLIRARKPKESLEVFLRVDGYVRHGTKWIYELDNLSQMIPLLPRHQRFPYVLRLSLLSCKITAAEEVVQVGDQLMEGRILSPLLGSGVRISLKIPPAIVARTRMMLA